MFAYTLQKQPNSIVKFVLSVDWDNENEANLAANLLADWPQPDIAYALKLLSNEFQHPSVRQFAVRRLEEASDDELEMYLLQLVAAIRYEQLEGTDSLASMRTRSSDGPVDVGEDKVRAFCSVFVNPFRSLVPLRILSRPAAHSSRGASMLLQDGITSPGTARAEVVSPGTDGGDGVNDDDDNGDEDEEEEEGRPGGLGRMGAQKRSLPPLANFLVRRACESQAPFSFANFFYWFLKVEAEADEKHGNLYSKVWKEFRHRATPSIKTMFNEQERVVTNVLQAQMVAKGVSGNRDAKQLELRKLLAEVFHCNSLVFGPSRSSSDTS